MRRGNLCQADGVFHTVHQQIRRSEVMTKEEIIKPENLVYKKPTLMNDNRHALLPGLQSRRGTQTHCRSH